MNIGVFGCDPGGATGLAWGIFNPHARDVGEMLKHRMNAGSATVEGSERAQIREIASIWQSFFNACVRSACLPPERIWFVCENFIYTSGNTYGGDSASISTALIWGVEGYRMGCADTWLSRRRGKAEAVMPPMILQSASEAKGFATGKRLKEWDVWVVGRDHERSAWQHIAFFLQKYRQQHN